MTRCALALIAVFLFAGAAAAQTVQRNFPATALRGEIAFGQPPTVKLNGEDARLAPGSRIRATNNLLQMSGALVGQTATVNYTLDPTGLVLEVWLLSEDERAKQPWPRTLKDAQSWRFDPVAQVWTPR
jgi:hypothetical protein